MLLPVLIALSAAPSQARCEPVFEKLLSQLQKEWARSPQMAVLAAKHTPELRSLFLKECSTLSASDLDCGEGKGNPDDEASCLKLEPRLRQECVAASRAERNNPMACKNIALAIERAGEIWGATLKNDPALQKAQEETVGGSWSKDAVTGFVKGCVANAPKDAPVDAKVFCDCMSGQLQARLSWREFSQMTANQKSGKPVNPSTVKKVTIASELCFQL